MGDKIICARCGDTIARESFSTAIVYSVGRLAGWSAVCGLCGIHVPANARLTFVEMDGILLNLIENKGWNLEAELLSAICSFTPEAVALNKYADELTRRRM